MDKKVVMNAKSYIDLMARGINPLTNEKIPNSDLLNNVKISRCLYYVSEVLDKVLKEDFQSFKKNVPFFIDELTIRNFEYSDFTMTSSEMIRRINALKTDPNMKDLTTIKMNKWLIDIGFLEKRLENGKTVKRPTSLGKEMGIAIEFRMGKYRNYFALTYDRKMQEFIVDNFGALTDFLLKEKN